MNPVFAAGSVGMACELNERDCSVDSAAQHIRQNDELCGLRRPTEHQTTVYDNKLIVTTDDSYRTD